MFAAALGICMLAVNALAQECHEPDVEASAGVASLAADVCAMGELLSRSPPNFKAAIALYRKGRNNLGETLEEAAQRELRCATCDIYALGSGGPGWVHVLIQDSIKGYQPFETDIARAQNVKTLLQSVLLSQRCIYHLENSGVQLVEDNVEEAILHWDSSMAAFYGSDVDCAIFGDGAIVGRDFQTKDPSLADINLRIAQMYKAGRDAIDADDVDGLNIAIDDIRRNIFIIYIRAIIKSTILMGQAHKENKSFAKFQGEGQALIDAIRPAYTNCAAEGVYPVEDIIGFYLYFPEEGSAFKTVEDIVEGAKCLGITLEEIGEFTGGAERSSTKPKSKNTDSANSCYEVNPWAELFAGGQN